jgi:hypothetical protein
MSVMVEPRCHRCGYCGAYLIYVGQVTAPAFEVDAQCPGCGRAWRIQLQTTQAIELPASEVGA